MFFKSNQDTQLKLTFKINEVVVPYFFSNKEPFNHKLSEQHAGYHSILSDLNTSFDLLDKYYDKFNDPMLDDTVWRQSILLIGRTFAEGEGRKVKLEVKNFTEENGLRDFLKRVIKIRNSFIAHHGLTEMSLFLTVVVLSDANNLKSISDVTNFGIENSSGSREEIEEIKKLVKILIDWTKNKIKKLSLQIKNDFEAMDIEDLYRKSFKP
jgi:hypothetical protein